MLYLDGNLTIAYTLQQQNIRTLPLSSKEYKGIPLYFSSEFIIPSGLQVIHNTGLSLRFPKGLHGEVIGPHNWSRLEPWISLGIVMYSNE